MRITAMFQFGVMVRRLLAISIFAVPAGMVQAVEWTAPSESELALLPPYCAAKFRPNSPDREYWHRNLGRIFLSIHHYCQGLNFVNRYYRTSGREQGSMLKFALDEFNYMLKNPNPSDVLVPEIYVQRATALVLAKRDEEALRDYLRALELNPRYGKAYLDLINFYTDRGQRGRALEVATRSLRYLPDVEILKKRYDELGGTQPYPAPLVQSKDVETNQEEEPVVAAAEDEPVVTDSPVAIPPDEFPREDRKNPWCRFCTE